MFIKWKENPPLKHLQRMFFSIYLAIVREECPDSEIENFLSTNWSEFAVKGDWNIKISQIRTKVFLLKKSSVFSETKPDFFFKIDKAG